MNRMLIAAMVVLAGGIAPGPAFAMKQFIGPPLWSPDGTRIAFAGETGTYTMTAAGGQLRRILKGTGMSDVAWSPDGRRFAYSAYTKTGSHLYTVGTDGRGRVDLTKKGSKHGDGNDDSPRWSPDGKSIAFTRLFKIAVMSPDGRKLARISRRGSDGQPVWSPDGQRIAFLSTRDGCCPNPGDEGSADLYVMNADGSNVRRLTVRGMLTETGVWSPDGTQLAYGAVGDIFAVDVATATVRNLTQTESVEYNPAWSPDGTRLAYQGAGDPNGNLKGIYVMNADGSGQQRLTEYDEDAGDNYPAWSPDATRIAFLRERYSGRGTLRFIYSMNADGSDQRALTP